MLITENYHVFNVIRSCYMECDKVNMLKIVGQDKIHLLIIRFYSLLHKIAYYYYYYLCVQIVIKLKLMKNNCINQLLYFCIGCVALRMNYFRVIKFFSFYSAIRNNYLYFKLLCIKFFIKLHVLNINI